MGEAARGDPSRRGGCAALTSTAFGGYEASSQISTTFLTKNSDMLFQAKLLYFWQPGDLNSALCSDSAGTRSSRAARVLMAVRVCLEKCLGRHVIQLSLSLPSTQRYYFSALSAGFAQQPYYL